jgi:hypothetical protein
VTGANATAPGGGVLAHWAFLPAQQTGGFGALRVRIFRPALSGTDVVVRTARADGSALVRELYQGGSRCVEEHWWPAGAAPAGLLTGETQETGRQARPRVAGRLLPVESPVAAEAHLLAAALDVAVRGEARRVISVAARFDTVPAGPLACTVRICAAAEGRIRLEVETDSGTPVLRATVWFGCGAAKRAITRSGR